MDRFRFAVVVVGVALTTLAGSVPAAGAVGEERDGRSLPVVAAGGFSDAEEAGVHLEAVNSLRLTVCSRGRNVGRGSSVLGMRWSVG